MPRRMTAKQKMTTSGICFAKPLKKKAFKRKRLSSTAGMPRRKSKFIHRLGKFFVTTFKENRLISFNEEQGYIHLRQVKSTPEQLQYGITVKLKEVPFKVQLFKVVATNGDIEWVITNRTQVLSTRRLFKTRTRCVGS